MENEKRDLCRVIVETAEADADKIIAAAEEYAKTVKERSDAEVAEYSEAENAKIKTETEEVGRKKDANARMDAKKQTLLAKTETVAEVYAKTLDRLKAISKKDGLSLAGRLIEKYAAEGDTVLVGKESPFGVSDVLGLAAVGKKKLSVESGDFGAGLIVRGEKYDTDLTFAALVDYARETTETEIAERLFGDKNQG